MKNATSFGMFAAVAFAIGMAGINLSDGTFEMQSNTASSYSEGGSILGHMEIIHTDNEGNILSYQQTDNAIVNDGRNCTAMLLFGQNSGCTAGTASALGKYTVIGISNGSALVDTTLNTVLPAEITVGDGLNAVAGSLGTFTNSTADSDPAIQRITNQFTYSSSATQTGNTINAAGLFNQTGLGADRGVFALKNFPSSVTMNPGDQLTVNWDITIDGSDDIS
ncbi:hypothetical protein C6990_01805 [Nitrosopumilus sp. b3]|uniref:hypothetical protein n=1 Tax=Nitrosopumilus sp. b3 TaxID=2109909 RepID=UPI0015F49A45|nr:hypothetical protein [Nitrosopumilus sp. b3]KAF6248195.1 hypothetical protein C6990_01805 [Nitrosopumilus sp. b3]